MKAFFPSHYNNYHPFILRPKNLFILAVILLVIKFLVFSWFFYFPKTSEFAVVTSSELIDLANKERVFQGLQPLEINEKLVQAAQQKAQDMLDNGYFAHTSPGGITPWHWFDVVGYNYVAAGENLAKDFTDSQFLHRAWMNSSSHRDNILNGNYQEMGIVVVEGEINGRSTVLAVQMFGATTKAKTEETIKSVSQPRSPVQPPASVASPPAEEITTVSGINQENKIEIQKTAEQTGQTAPVIKITTAEKSESVLDDLYFIIAGLLILILLLTIFVNIRVQYPQTIFTALIIIILIIGIASFNDQAFLNRGINILTGASIYF